MWLYANLSSRQGGYAMCNQSDSGSQALCSLAHLETVVTTVSAPSLHDLPRMKNPTKRTGEDSLWDSSRLMPRRRSSDRRGWSIRRERQSACIRQHLRLVTSKSLDQLLTCCWHFASLKLFFWMQAFMYQLRLPIIRIACLTLDGTCSWVAWRIAFDVLF